MAKDPEANFKQVTALIDKAVEPKIRKLVETFNEEIAKLKVRVGVEVKWFLEEVKDK